ncbi:MAG: nucleoside kinase [Chthoniobacterales bacterium]|nr:nucleoside kinase [Chthoniobacterales bacterium]
MEETHLRKQRQTVKLGLIKAVSDLFPDYRLKTAYSIQEGVYCNLVGSTLSEREVRRIEEHLDAWVASDRPVHFLRHEDGYYHYDVDGLLVRALYPAENRSSLVEPFNIIPFSSGFIVDFGDVKCSGDTPLIPPEKLAESYEKTQRWLRNINIELVADVNEFMDSGRSHEILGISEALQEKEISDIADMILQQRRALRVLLISGPSSSGKTSFAQRLATQLKVNGLRPVPLSLDDYFLDREQTPRDASGRPDFESLGALDLHLLQDHVARLVEGEEVAAPRFDFHCGCRIAETRPMRLGRGEILVIEGIHALNPQLLPGLERNVCWKIYINALFELNLDLMNRIPTTEVRLIRRLVRGDLFRGTHPEKTIDQWSSVRRGEYLHVFKYQEEADAMFNSSMLYEMNALRPFAEKSLCKIPDRSTHVATRDRLLNLLGFFRPMPSDKVPWNSILREFIGGSVYFDPANGGHKLPH